MIVGSYLLQLYCDFGDDSYEHRGSADHPGPAFAEIGSEESLTRSKRAARRAGWRFSGNGISGQKCLCPWCCKKGRKLSNQ